MGIKLTTGGTEKMKKFSYTKPELKITTYCSADVITASTLRTNLKDEDIQTPINTTGMLGFGTKSSN